MRKLLGHLVGRVPTPVNMSAANQATQAILGTPEFGGKLRHVPITYAFAKEQVQLGTVVWSFDNSHGMLVDYLTKPVPGEAQQ